MLHKIEVRLAEEKDLPILCVWGEQFYSNTGFSEEPCMNEFLSSLVKDQACLVAENDDVLVGSIGGCVNKVPYTRNVTLAQELFWWVNTEYRGSGVGKILLEAFTLWAKDRGADYLVMVHLANNPSLSVFYVQEGFKGLESSFIRPLKGSI